MNQLNQNRTIEVVSYLLMGVFIIGSFYLHLMTTVVSGITLYLLVTHFYGLLSPKMKSNMAHKITLVSLIAIVVLILTGIFFAIYSAIKTGNGNFQQMGNDSFAIIQEIKTYLPTSVVDYIPDDFLLLKEKVLETIKASSGHIFEVTGHSLKALVHVILGLFLGAIVAFSFLKPESRVHSEPRPLRDALIARITRFTEVFKKVMAAQVKISAINTILTGIYLLIILPVVGITLPYGKTLVILTFVFGLIPVLGNLITNTLIFLISLTVSFKVAIASIVFLVVVHKLEYYINAKIVGEKIKTSIWELLIAMLLMETLFGILGVALAPVIYGYLKEELKVKGLI